MAKRVMAKTLLNDDEIVMLISFVRGRECLWNENHSDYKRISITKRFWSEIGAQLNISGDDAKSKWKNLKEKFKKLLRKSPADENQESTSTSASDASWRFYNEMLFLRGGLRQESAYSNMTATTTSGNIAPSTSGGAAQKDEVDGDFEEFDFDFLVKKASDGESDPGGKRFPGGGIKRKKSVVKVNDESEEAEEKKFVIPAIPSSPVHQQDERKGNDDYHFLLSLLPYIQALDPVEKLELRSKVQNIVTDSYKRHDEIKRSRLGH